MTKTSNINKSINKSTNNTKVIKKADSNLKPKNAKTKSIDKKSKLNKTTKI